MWQLNGEGDPDTVVFPCNGYEERNMRPIAARVFFVASVFTGAYENRAIGASAQQFGRKELRPLNCAAD